MGELVAGIDEVGRGPLAGPVVAAVCVFQSGFTHKKINDSKKLSAKMRDNLYEEIISLACGWAIVAVGPEMIDRINIRNATKLAMSLALKRVTADRALIDGNMLIDTDLPQTTVIGGDGLCVEIGAASIIAKVWRDRLMAHYDQIYPGYGLAGHAGYPTPAHKAAVATLGPSPIHRRTFAGVKEHVHRLVNPLDSISSANSAI